MEAVISVLFLIGNVGIAMVVYQDARRNSTQSAFLWSLVVLFGFLVGALLYVLLGRDGGSKPPDHRPRQRRRRQG